MFLIVTKNKKIPDPTTQQNMNKRWWIEATQTTRTDLFNFSRIDDKHNVIDCNARFSDIGC